MKINKIVPLWLKGNIFKEKHSYNQRSELTTNKMLNDCPIISALANLVYNAGIQPNAKAEALYETEDNIDKAAVALGLHSDELGGYASVFEVVGKYLETYKFEKVSEKDLAGKIEIIKLTKDDKKKINTLISLGYSLRVLVGVNKLFFKNGRKFGELKDLIQYKGDLNHFINITATGIIDNYAGYGQYFNTYKCNYEEVLKELNIGNTIYAFIRKY